MGRSHKKSYCLVLSEYVHKDDSVAVEHPFREEQRSVEIPAECTDGDNTGEGVDQPANLADANNVKEERDEEEECTPSDSEEEAKRARFTASRLDIFQQTRCGFQIAEFDLRFVPPRPALLVRDTLPVNLSHVTLQRIIHRQVSWAWGNIWPEAIWLRRWSLAEANLL